MYSWFGTQLGEKVDAKAPVKAPLLPSPAAAAAKPAGVGRYLDAGATKRKPDTAVEPALVPNDSEAAAKRRKKVGAGGFGDFSSW